MKFRNIASDAGGWDLSGYFTHLASIKSVLPENLYAFAANRQNYSLDGRASLHDAWVNSLRVEEGATGSRSERRWLDIHLELLGPYHDLNIRIKYTKVSSYSIDHANVGAGHGDVLMHEIDVLGDKRFLHQLIFSGGGSLAIVFEEFEHAVIPLGG